MSVLNQNAERWWMMSAIALVLLTAAQGRMCVGQAAAAANAKAALGQGVVLDRVGVLKRCNRTALHQPFRGTPRLSGWWTGR